MSGIEIATLSLAALLVFERLVINFCYRTQSMDEIKSILKYDESYARSIRIEDKVDKALSKLENNAPFIQTMYKY